METLVSSKRDMILWFFLENPTNEVHLRQLSRKLRISLPWVRKTVDELARKGFVRKRKLGGLVLVKANRDSRLFLALKRSSNIYSLWSCGLVDCLIESFGKPEAIVLFGSYSRGEDTESSDIDIAVITTRTVPVDLARFEKELRRGLQILRISASKIEKDFQKTLANGIVLYGYLQ